MTETYDRLNEIGRLLDGEGYGTEADCVYEVAEEHRRLRETLTLTWELLTKNEPRFVWEGLCDRMSELGIEVE